MSATVYALSTQVPRRRAQKVKPRYHRRDCYHLRWHAEHVIALTDAERESYQPCRVCIGRSH